VNEYTFNIGYIGEAVVVYIYCILQCAACKQSIAGIFIPVRKKGSANFSASGEWLETEMAIPQSATPQAVLDGFKKAHTGATIAAIYKRETKKGQNYFEIEYKVKGGKTKEAKLASDGKLM